ncbi:DNA recombination protein RmuC [Aureicoccus marinus]|uniref:DNA polymerase V n=1 Tax=Aureicoccus marinus TaxID=754435 RepID=A0A2S7T4E1_9FLAO|nr:DNA recombination protein RmuC [Aureicoccus marinus]PQJ14802.1 DNA polymerase V [Aureicoccus marinus]
MTLDPFVFVLLLFVTLVLGGLLGFFVQKKLGQGQEGLWAERQLQQEKQVDELRGQLQKSEEIKQQILQEQEGLKLKLQESELRREGVVKQLEDQKEELEKLQEKFTLEFENLAQKILDEKSEKFALQNQKNIKVILDPLKEKIKQFETKVDDTQKANIGIHAALKQQLEHLQAQNMKMTKETENLTKALKGDSKMQGNWGELVLERVLEKSGLEKDREYSVQQSHIGEDGQRLMPDVIIHLPDGKKMIVDSKVSLTDYERYVNAESEEDQQKALKQHMISLQRHIDQLSAKKYEDLYQMESPDFVLLFVPIEPAFALAMNHNNDFYVKAFEKNIVIVTPTTLLATLRTIDSMWVNEKQRKNAIEIARQAGALYDKFEGFVGDLTRVGKRMDDAKKEYEGAMNKLVLGRGNLVVSVQKLKQMGAKAKKALPEAILNRAQQQPEAPDEIENTTLTS